MKNFQRVFVLTFILAGLFTLPLESASNELSRVIEHFSEEVDREDGLSYTTSLGLGRDKIRDVSLFYSSKKPMQIDEARELIVKLTHSFVEDMNHNEYLKQDLVSYPFTAEHLDITIFFRGKDGKYAKMPDIAQVSMHKGIISFYKFSQGSFKVVHQENLNRAEKIALN